MDGWKVLLVRMVPPNPSGGGCIVIIIVLVILAVAVIGGARFTPDELLTQGILLFLIIGGILTALGMGS